MRIYFEQGRPVSPLVINERRSGKVIECHRFLLAFDATRPKRRRE